MTLFGVGGLKGANNIVDWGTVTTGRVGYGYVYPDFNARFAWASPNMNGFGLSVGIYDPSEPGNTVRGALGGGSGQYETDVPRFEGELTYTTAFTNGAATIWVDGTWQEVEATAINTLAGIVGSPDYDREGWGVGGQISMAGFEATGYYYDGDNLGTAVAFAGAPGINAAGGFEDAETDGFYAQGTYTFNGRTKIGVSYGESNQDGDIVNLEGENEMWTVGVYHDITSWLRVMAEYSEAESDTQAVAGGPTTQTQEYDLFSVGCFILW